MNLVQPYAKLLEVEDLTRGIQLLKKIEWCGRISHRSEEAQSENSWDRFIRAVVLQHGDWSIVEHAIATVDMLVDRGITHEVVRHRLFSFTQESTRFCNYGKSGGINVIYPFSEENPEPKCEVSWEVAMYRTEETYLDMLSKGIKPQVARAVLPNSLASRILITGNLRNWRHFFLMRTTKEAHPQMRQVAIPLLREFQEKIPILYEDIEPEARQVDNLKKAR